MQSVFRAFFGQVWGNLGKNPSHPQKFASPCTCAFQPFGRKRMMNSPDPHPQK